MRKDINLWALNCLNCQKSKIQHHTRPHIQKIAIPSTRFEHIHMDIVGPFPVSNGNRYILTIIDRFTRWPEAYPIKDISSITIAKTFVNQYLPRFGVPLQITVDQGSQFTSRLFNNLTKLIGSHKIHTSCYHPQANGMVERFHRQLKAALKSRNNVNNWSDELSIILLGIRTSIKEDLNCSPSELVYGQTLRLPGELVVNNNSNDHLGGTEEVLRQLRDHFSSVRSKVIHHKKNIRHYIPKDLHKCDYVFIKVLRPKGLETPYDGPFKVIERKQNTFRIQCGNLIKTVAIEHLKPAHVENDYSTIPVSHKRYTTYNLF